MYQPKEAMKGSIPPSTGSSSQKETFHQIDKDHVWINGVQYISLTRVGQMIEESRQNRKTEEITIGVSVDTTEIDTALDKARELKDIISSLARG